MDTEWETGDSGGLQISLNELTGQKELKEKYLKDRIIITGITEGVEGNIFVPSIFSSAVRTQRLLPSFDPLFQIE